jgi:ABC-type Mn2+/Zn2+ transport system permease subunit
MGTLLQIYWLPILASIALSVGLAQLGAQLAARDRAMQTLCIGQGAMLGVLAGIGIAQVLGVGELAEAIVPFVLAVFAAIGTFAVSERLVAHKSASRNTHFAALFAALLAGGYLVSALFPALENHMAQKYFGDLATISQPEAWSTLLIGSALSAWLTIRASAVTRESFAASILGGNPYATAGGRIFALVALAAICFSVQIVGFLFTTACLFIPTAIAAASRRVGLRHHLTAICISSGAAAAIGFLLSLYLTRLPTVPAIVAVMSVSSFAFLF